LIPALETLNQIPNQKAFKIAVIGDILELGIHSKRIHKNILKNLNNYRNINKIIVYGKHFYNASKAPELTFLKTNHQVEILETLEQAKAQTLKIIKSTSDKHVFLLTKASHGLRSWEIWQEWAQ